MATTTKQADPVEADVDEFGGDFKVLVGALVLRLDEDGKKVERFLHGRTVTAKQLANVDVEYLVKLKAIGREDAKIPTPFGIGQAAAEANQENVTVPVQDGLDQLPLPAPTP